MGLLNYTTRIATAQFEGHTIEVLNKWKMFPPKTLSTLSIDGVELTRSTAFVMPTPNIAQLAAENVNEAIEYIHVFFAGVFSIKISIVVNGEVVHKDALSAADRLHVEYSEKS